MTCRSNRYVADVRVREVGGCPCQRQCGWGSRYGYPRYGYGCGYRQGCGCECGQRFGYGYPRYGSGYGYGCGHRGSQWRIHAVVEERNGYRPFGERQGFDGECGEEFYRDGNCCEDDK